VPRASDERIDGMITAIEGTMSDSVGSRPRPPDAHEGPVPRQAIVDLFASVDGCAGRAIDATQLLDVDIARHVAGAFKLDVSFDFSPSRRARFSVNDKGEPEGFRARAERVLPTLGLPRHAVRSFFDIAPPGEVQTTLAVKWGDALDAPDRISLYYEELYRAASFPRIREAVFGIVDARAPAVPAGAEPVAVCVDYRAGEPVAAKTYDMFVQHPGEPPPYAPAALARAIDELPFHPINGTRRYMIAARHRRGGELVGHKLLWMTEIHRPALVEWAWRQFDAWRAQWGTGAHPDVQRAFDSLRQSWSHGPVAFLHPDLVCLNFDRAGSPELVAYVSVR